MAGPSHRDLPLIHAKPSMPRIFFASKQRQLYKNSKGVHYCSCGILPILLILVILPRGLPVSNSVNSFNSSYSCYSAKSSAPPFW